MDNVLFTNFIYEEARNDIVYNTIITLVNVLPMWNYRNGKMRIGSPEVEYSGQLGDLLKEIADIPRAVAKEINEILSTAPNLTIVVTNPTVRIFCTDRFGNSIYKWIDETTIQFVNRIKNTPFVE